MLSRYWNTICFLLLFFSIMAGWRYDKWHRVYIIPGTVLSSYWWIDSPRLVQSSLEEENTKERERGGGSIYCWCVTADGMFIHEQINSSQRTAGRAFPLRVHTLSAANSNNSTIIEYYKQLVLLRWFRLLFTYRTAVFTVFAIFGSFKNIYIFYIDFFK